MTSLSVMPPTPACSTCAPTSSVPSLSSAPWIASAEPCTSALMTSGNSRFSPASRVLSNWSRVWREDVAWRASRRLRARYSVTSRARASESTTDHFVARFRRGRQAEHLDRHRRAGALRPFRRGRSTSRRTRPHSEPATTMSPTLSVPRWHQHGGDRPAALVELGLDHRAFGGAVGIGLEVEHFGLQQDRFFELVEAGALGRGDFDGHGLAAHILDLDLVLQQLGLDPLRIGVALVDLVDRRR